MTYQEARNEIDRVAAKFGIREDRKDCSTDRMLTTYGYVWDCDPAQEEAPCQTGGWADFADDVIEDMLEGVV